MTTIALDEHSPIWKRAEALYAEGVRGYHSFQHALDVLDRVDKVQRNIGFMDHDAVRFAALYHDAVYVAGAMDNEYQSAWKLNEAIRETYRDSTTEVRRRVVEIE